MAAFTALAPPIPFAFWKSPTVASGTTPPPTPDYMQWKLNDGSGTIADATGNGRTGTLAGTGTSWVTGQDGVASHALNLTGSADVTHTGNGQISYPFTFTAWVKTTSTSAGVVFGQFAHSPAEWYGDYLYVGADGTVSAGSANNNVFVGPGSGTVNDGNWHLLAGVWTSSTLRSVYVDGVFLTSDPTALTPTLIDSLCLGASFRSSVDNFFTGTVDDVRIYSSALSTAQILAIYNAGAQ